jgi:hypothetical protein
MNRSIFHLSPRSPRARPSRDQLSPLLHAVADAGLSSEATRHTRVGEVHHG